MKLPLGPAAFTILILLSAAPLRAAERPPNIVFIHADDLGYGDLGSYGQKRIQTPHLDRMAAEGMRFTQYYAGAAMCAPSRCVLMTGLHLGHARTRANSPQVSLELEDVTVAEVLKPAGYTTGVIGKWALGDKAKTGLPNQQGFDEWFGFPTQTSGWDCYPEFLMHNTSKYPVEKNAGGQTGQFADDLFTEKAIEFIRGNRERPFFLYLPYISPHANQVAKKKGIYAPSTAPYSQEDWPEHEKNFAAMITRMDGGIGRLLALLKELQLDEQTIVFFTSDNGAHNAGGHDEKFFNSSGPLRGRKFQPFEGGVRVPMIVRWPGRIMPAVSDQVWAHWDFLPTAAELAGATAPPAIDGISFLPALLGKPQPRQHEFLYWEFHDSGFTQAVRMGDWKAIRATGRPMALFDLKADLGETKNLAAGEPAVIARIEAYLKSARTESAVWPIAPGVQKKQKKADER